jgi:hypothetical protein
VTTDVTTDLIHTIYADIKRQRDRRRIFAICVDDTARSKLRHEINEAYRKYGRPEPRLSTTLRVLGVQIGSVR